MSTPGRFPYRRPRLSYANVTATLALVSALGGTSYAVSQLPRDSVGAAQIRRGAVGGDEIRDGSVSRSELAPEATQAGPRGPRGPQGPPGPDGLRGPIGERGPSEVFIARNNPSVGIPFGSATLVSELSLQPGAYAIDFAAHTFLATTSTWVDCRLEADGQQLTKTATHVGGDPQATVEAVITMTEGAQFTSAVRLRVSCSERAETSVQMADARLRAIRVGSVAVQ